MSIPSNETVTVRIEKARAGRAFQNVRARRMAAVGKPTRAAVAIVDESGYRLGMADLDQPGYTPTTWEYATYEEASASARLWNENAGVSPDRALQIVASSMRNGGVAGQ